MFENPIHNETGDNPVKNDGKNRPVKQLELVHIEQVNDPAETKRFNEKKNPVPKKSAKKTRQEKCDSQDNVLINTTVSVLKELIQLNEPGIHPRKTNKVHHAKEKTVSEHPVHQENSDQIPVNSKSRPGKPNPVDLPNKPKTRVSIQKSGDDHSVQNIPEDIIQRSLQNSNFFSQAFFHQSDPSG